MPTPATAPATAVAVHELHAGFTALLPTVDRYARFAFRAERCPDRRDDLVQETVALAWTWYARLVARGKEPARFPTTLACLAARAVRCGRRVCGQESSRDALSRLAQTRHAFLTSSLPEFDAAADDDPALGEALRDNTRTPPDEQAAFRHDYPLWLSTLGGRDRAIATDMSAGHQTRDLAAAYEVSQARISQLRREFHASWTRLTDAPEPTGDTRTAVAV